MVEFLSKALRDKDFTMVDLNDKFFLYIPKQAIGLGFEKKTANLLRS